MEFDNSFEVPLPPDQAWPMLMDVRGIAPCMPGAQLTEVIDDKNYKGNISVRLGPVALTFAGIVTFEEIDNANYTARVRAQGTDAKGRGSAQAKSTFRLEPTAHRLQGAGAHRPHAVGRGRAVRPRRRHDPGDRLGDHEPVRQRPEGADRAASAGGVRCAGNSQPPTRGSGGAVSRAAAALRPRHTSTAAAGGEADLRLLADGDGAVEFDQAACSAAEHPDVAKRTTIPSSWSTRNDVAGRHRGQARRAPARPAPSRHLGARSQQRRRIPAAAPQPPRSTTPADCGPTPAAAIRCRARAWPTPRKRRLLEEMGVACPLEPLFRFSYRADVPGGLIENEVVHVFGGAHDGPVKPDPAEVDDWKWIALDALERRHQGAAGGLHGVVPALRRRARRHDRGLDRRRK